MSYIDYQTDVCYPPDEQTVQISTTHNLGSADTSIVDAVKALDGVTDASLCRGPRPGSGDISEVNNTIVVRKGDDQVWEGGLLTRVQDAIMTTLFPPGPPPPPAALHEFK